jgi:hypothetical protein
MTALAMAADEDRRQGKAKPEVWHETGEGEGTG